MQRRRFRFILYLIPALMDCVTGIFFFIGPVRATLLGYDPLVAGSVVSSRSVACCLVSLVISRWLTSKNAVYFMFFSNLGLIFTCLAGLGATNLLMLYVTSAMCGASVVTFSAAFQVFAKAVDSGEKRTVSQVAGSYTMSWCIGMSFGPFITGALMQLGKPADGVGLSTGWIYAYLAGALIAFGMLLGFLWVRKTSGEFMRQLREKKTAEKIDLSEGRGKPDLAWLGWLTAILGVCVNGIVRGVFPAGVTQGGMPEWRSGLIMMLMSVAMGLFAYRISLGHKWMYSGKTMLSLGVLGVIGLSFYYLPWMMGWGMVDHAWAFYLAALLFGSYSGTTYVYSAFHALVHPDKDGRNIALNETSVAVGMMFGPVLGGWIAKHYGFYPPFMLATVIVALIGIVQFSVHRRLRTDE